MSSDKGTIKIPREDFKRHNERRKEMGITWAEYIDGEAPDVRNGYEGVETQLEALEREIEQAKTFAEQAKNNTEQIHEEMR